MSRWNELYPEFDRIRRSCADGRIRATDLRKLIELVDAAADEISNLISKHVDTGELELDEEHMRRFRQIRTGAVKLTSTVATSANHKKHHADPSVEENARELLEQRLRAKRERM